MSSTAGGGGGGASSTLSTDSPPFNPRGITSIGSQSPSPNITIGNNSNTNSNTNNNNTSSGSSSSTGHTNYHNSHSHISSSSNHTNSNHGRSRTASPMSEASAPAAGTGKSFSNAIAKHTFQYESETLEIRNVWAENVEEEMAYIRELIETHPYVAMDTEFPGVVARPVSETYSPDFHYKSLKVNVDLLKIIQLGLSFADEEGNFAKGCPCWQFNFKFNLNDDMFAQDSIDLLVNSGISFDDHATRGIDPLRFGEILMVSGLVLDDRVRWVSFHSGYDYGYLLKLLTTQELPNDEKTFFETLKLYFPTIYDIKYMTSLCDGHFGGLQKLADALGCQRIGTEHQAGSDSLLTMTTYFSLARAKFSTGPTGEIDDAKYKNELYGYGGNHTVRKGNAHAHVHLSTSSSALSVSNGSSVGGGE